jgi:hypothetical protein
LISGSPVSFSAQDQSRRLVTQLGGVCSAARGETPRAIPLMVLEHYQQTKNLLVSYSPKKLGCF